MLLCNLILVFILGIMAIYSNLRILYGILFLLWLMVTPLTILFCVDEIFETNYCFKVIDRIDNIINRGER